MGAGGIPLPHEYTLAELARLSNTPGRTIRYYIARGVLAGPAKGGRGAFYTDDHLRTLRQIKVQQNSGQTLAEIKYRAEVPVDAREPTPEQWWVFRASEDVLVQVRAGSSPWRLHRIHAMIARLTAELGEEPEREEAKR